MEIAKKRLERNTFGTMLQILTRFPIKVTWCNQKFVRKPKPRKALYRVVNFKEFVDSSLLKLN